jgi:membrane fusion protein, multidrug efflux system
MNTTTYPGSVDLPSDENKGNPVRPRPRFRRIIVVGGALLLIALVVGFIPQWQQRQTATADTNQLAIATVGVVTPTLTTPNSGLDLPAEVKPWQEASIFARANGFLKSWLVDIGAHVEKDQLLAEIDTPDLDQQLAQARSQATLAQKSLEQAKSTNAKWQDLFHQGVVSELDSENMATSQATNQSNTEAFAANLRFLEQEVAFQRVTAPFAGTITARNVNVGDLITANNTSMEMFHIQQRDPLRVYFRVPQPEAPNIAVGQTFNVQIGAESAKTYPGKVASTSEAVSPDSRTMLVELQVDNSKNEILPGSYATVRLPANVLGKLLILPDNTLIFRGKDLQVGVVDAKGVVQLRDVKVGRDFGIQSEILSGVTESDKVIVNPSDSLTTGTIVHVAATPASSPAPAVAKK